MKKILFFLSSLLILSACEEKNDLIHLTPPVAGNKDLTIDSSYQSSVPTAQLKRVLLEDFTGIRCTNCPSAQKKAAGFETSHPGQVIIASLHVTSFAVPLQGVSKYDFRSPDANNVMTMIGKDAAGLPQGAFDRLAFSDNNNEVYASPILWQSHLDQRLLAVPPVNVDITKAVYDSVNHKLSGTIQLTYTKDVSVPNFLTVSVIESGMVDIQENAVAPSGWDTFYVQNHVLRKTVAPNNGLQLGSSFVAGKTYIVRFVTDWNTAWKAKNSKLIAFVHHRSTGDLEVLQAAEADIK